MIRKSMQMELWTFRHWMMRQNLLQDFQNWPRKRRSHYHRSVKILS